MSSVRGSAGAASGEVVILDALLVLRGAEAAGLQVEHRAVATSARHQLGVRAQLDPLTRRLRELDTELSALGADD